MGTHLMSTVDKKIAAGGLYLSRNGADKEGGAQVQKIDDQGQLTWARNSTPDVNRLLFFKSTPYSLRKVKRSETSRKIPNNNYDRINKDGENPWTA